MINLADLCAEMEQSGRHLTPRAARSWWIKGLLPRPQRRGLGREKGTETFWLNPHVVDQAKATYDLLARHSRTYTTLIGLWLLGFPIELKLVRKAWLKLIEHNRPQRRIWASNPFDDEGVGELAPRVAKSLLRLGTPADIKDGLTNVLVEIYSAYYGTDDKPDTTGFGKLLAETIPYLSKGTLEPVMFDDAHIEWFIANVRDWVSLPKQRETLESARNYELVRARRVIHVVLGIFGRAARHMPDGQLKSLEELTVLSLGRAALLPLVAILRKSPPEYPVIPKLLSLSRSVKEHMASH